jgi:hypothetical protein
MSTISILSEVKQTGIELIETIAAFTEEELNQVPFAGSWTAGQVAEHLLKSESGLPLILRGSSRPTEGSPDENVEEIRNIFLDFSTKMHSPEIILPAAGPKNKEKLISALEAKRRLILELTSTTDLTRTFTTYPFPGMGMLTGREWLCFLVCHTKRHIHQMKNIYSMVRAAREVDSPAT